MMEDFKKLFGSTPEIKVISAIIPYATIHTFTADQVVKATGLSKKQVDTVIQKFKKFNLLIGEEKLMIRASSNMARSMHALVHAAYEDKLIAEQKAALTGDEK